MTKPSIHSIKITVGVRDVDFKKEMRISSMLRHFQEAASSHVDTLGIGISEMEANTHIAWVLTKMKIEIIRYPKFKEHLTIETWPQLPNAIEFQRDFIIKDAEGNTIAKALSGWVIIDMETRELRRSNIVTLNHLDIKTDRAIGNTFDRLMPEGEKTLIYNRAIRYSDIDLMGHLNNAKYIDFITDSFTVKEHTNQSIKALQIAFSHEALFGDEIKIVRAAAKNQTSDFIYFEGINETTNQTSFKSLISLI